MGAKKLSLKPLFILKILFILVAANLSATLAHASAELREGFLRTGYVTGTFQGQEVTDGTFNTDVNIQAEFWLYKNPTEAWTFQLLLANESELGRSRYFGGGIGQRYFWKGEANYSQSQQGSDFLQFKSSFAYYYGWDFNVVQFLVVPFGEILSTYSTLAEAGGVVGVRRPINAKISVDATAGYYLGYTVSSSVSVTTGILRALVGIGMAF
jgi:hypothetical protein